MLIDGDDPLGTPPLLGRRKAPDADEGPRDLTDIIDGEPIANATSRPQITNGLSDADIDALADLAAEREAIRGEPRASQLANGPAPKSVWRDGHGVGAADAPSPFRVRTLDSLLAQNMPEIGWIWAERQLVAPGRPSLIVGYGGTCKTWLALGAGLSVATGCAWLGAYPARTGRAVHLSYEVGLRRTWRRLARMVHGLGLTDCSLFELASQEDLGIHLDDPAAEGHLDRLLDGAVLCTVDALLASAPAANENSAEISVPLQMLARVSARTGCAIIVLHHARKTSPENSGSPHGERSRGHSSIHQFADAMWMTGADGSLRAAKVSDGRPPQGYQIAIVDTDGGGIVVEATDLPAEDGPSVAGLRGEEARAAYDAAKAARKQRQSMAAVAADAEILRGVLAEAGPDGLTARDMRAAYAAGGGGGKDRADAALAALGAAVDIRRERNPHGGRESVCHVLVGAGAPL